MLDCSTVITVTKTNNNIGIKGKQSKYPYNISSEKTVNSLPILKVKLSSSFHSSLADKSASRAHKVLRR